MVSPSCCLQYRPTLTFWAILIFIVFPLIYFTGKVVGTVLTVLVRVLRGLCKLALWDDEDYEEEEERKRLERQAMLIMREEARRIRHRGRQALKLCEKEARQCAEKNEKVSEEMTSLVANGEPREAVAKCSPPSDISESLNSECETDEQRVTPLRAEASSSVGETTLTNGHATLPNATGTAEASTVRQRHLRQE